MNNYIFEQHQHNFSVWTAARAVQRNFTSTHNIQAAIDKSDLRRFAENPSLCTHDLFDEFHRHCCQQLIASFMNSGVEASYGRAAKIMAIYLKTSIILCNKGQCRRSSVIHPPVDRILLATIANNHQELSDLKLKSWTKMDEACYWDLVSRIRYHFRKFDWTLEHYWQPE